MAELSNLGKPRVLDAVMENINPVLVEDITRTQECNHVEKGELMLVDHCRGREGAGQEMECWGTKLWNNLIVSTQLMALPDFKDHIKMNLSHN